MSRWGTLYGSFGKASAARAGQIILALCCFGMPLLLMPLAWRESGTNLWVRAGLPKGIVKTLLVPGGEPSLRCALVASGGVYRSTDNGMTWRAANSGLPPDRLGRSQVQTLGADEGNPSLVYAGMIAVEPEGSELGTGLYLSDDAGATWLGLGQEMTGRGVQTIAAASYAAGSAICVAGGRQIHRSTDRGRSWSRLDWRGVEVSILSLAIRPNQPDVVYVGTAGGGLYRTSNGGTSWVALNEDLEDLDIHCIAISPARLDSMYLGTNGGVYGSTDAGATWKKLRGPAMNRHVTALALDPHDEDVVYVGLEHGGAYRTADAGQQWVPLKRGLGDLTVSALTLDPGNASILWAGTSDGVWRYVFGTAVSPPVAQTALPPTSTPTLQPTPLVTTLPAVAVSPTIPPSPQATAAPTGTHTPTLTPTHTKPAPTRAPTLTPTPTTTATTVPPTAVPPTAPPPASPVPTETPVIR